MIHALRYLSLLLFVAALAGCSDSNNDNVVTVTAFDDCNLPPDQIEVFASDSGIEFVRTPVACFESLDGFLYNANYALVDGMQMHYVDAGPSNGEVVLMLHGQPSWSYLYRKMIPVLAEAGFRVIAVDHIGMGRSDKPVDPRVHTFDQQVVWNTAFIEALGLQDITLFVQDWGSLIGLQVAGLSPNLFARIVIANGNLPGIPPGLNPFTLPVFEFAESQPPVDEFFPSRTGSEAEQFQQWIDYAASAPFLFAVDVVQFASLIELRPEELAAYDAPFPSEIYRGAIRAFPSMLSGINGQTLPALEAYRRFDKPFLALAGEFDPGLGSVATQNSWINRVPGAQGFDHRRFEAGHFIQDDVGAEMAAHVAEFMRASPAPESGPLHDLRYCEVLLFRDTPDGVQAEVYNTILLNDCPQEQWDALDADAIAEEFDVLFAGRNGPRFWTLDLIVPQDNGGPQVPGLGNIETFGGIDMRLGGIVTVGDITSGEAEPYVVNEVQRNTLFVFVAGRRIYELHDPDGGRYVMQSFSRIVDEDLERHELAQLGSRLDLPPGWRFTSRVLAENLNLLADGIARVITDDFTNTYQKVE